MIVGSQPRNAHDVDALKAEGVGVILNLQQVGGEAGSQLLLVGGEPTLEWGGVAARDALALAGMMPGCSPLVLASAPAAADATLSLPTCLVCTCPQPLLAPSCHAPFRTRTWPTGRWTWERFRRALRTTACSSSARRRSTSRRTRCARRCPAVSGGGGPAGRAIGGQHSRQPLPLRLDWQPQHCRRKHSATHAPSAQITFAGEAPAFPATRPSPLPPCALPRPQRCALWRMRAPAAPRCTCTAPPAWAAPPRLLSPRSTGSHPCRQGSLVGCSGTERSSMQQETGGLLPWAWAALGC